MMDIELLKREGKLLKYQKGEKIFEEREYVSDIRVFFILKGEVMVYKKYTPLVKEEFLYKEGDFFGVLELFNQRLRITEAEAITDVEVLGFDKISFEKLLVSNVQISLKVIRTLSAMLRKANERIKHLPG